MPGPVVDVALPDVADALRAIELVSLDVDEHVARGSQFVEPVAKGAVGIVATGAPADAVEVEDVRRGRRRGWWRRLENCQGATKAVAILGTAGNPRPILVPQLIPTDGEAGGRTVDDVSGAGVCLIPDAFTGHADGEIGEAVPIQVARGEGAAEVVAVLRFAQHPLRILGPDLVAAAGRPTGGAVEHVDRAAFRQWLRVLPVGADSEIGIAVVVEIGGGNCDAKCVALFRLPGDARAVLVPELAAPPHETGGMTEEYVDGACPRCARRFD